MINEIMQQMAKDIGITNIILADQDGKQPKCPYGEYKISKMDYDNHHQGIEKREELPDNRVRLKKYYAVKTTIRLTFYNDNKDPNPLGSIMNHAKNAWFWFGEEGREVCKSYNMIPFIVSKEIKQEEDSVKKENKFQVGFEFALKGIEERVKEVETITGVDYTYEIKK